MVNVMKFVSTAELKRDTNKLIKQSESGEFLIITRHGKPCSVLMHVSEADLERYLFERNTLVRKRVSEGLKDLKAGRKMRLDEYAYARFGRE